MAVVVLVKHLGLVVSFLPPTLNASRISSSESVSCILRAMRVMNSAKSIELFPSASTWVSYATLSPTSLIMSSSSACVGFWPSERITVPSSLVVMVPSPSGVRGEGSVHTLVKEGEGLLEFCG